MRWAAAGLAYWAAIFALGFVLGTLRVMWLAPLVGRFPATALELPIMLGASWLVAGWLVQRFAIRSAGAALAMGAFAFIVLMAAECGLAAALMGQSPGEWLADLAQPHGLLGLAGQALFAGLPWWRVRRDSRARAPGQRRDGDT